MLIQKYINGETSVKIAGSIEEAVGSGKIAPGALLPPVRSLATTLGVSPATVASAYRNLMNRGVIVTDGRRGTRVHHAAPIAAPAEVALPASVRNLTDGNPDPTLLPDLAAAARATPVGQRLYGGTLNDERLLDLAREQFEADGIGAAHIAVVSGALDGIERVLREHLRPGDRVIVEDPCFTGILDLLSAQSLVPVPVPVDDEGVIVDELRRTLRSPVPAMIVTPRAQNPTGAAFSEKRARMLRAVLREHPDLLVIEDDHAGPVAGAAYRTLTGGPHERWAVVRSVSKSLGPDLRLALLAGDARTIGRVEGRQNLGVRWVSHILQHLVVTLWRSARVRKQLAHASEIYALRRRALVAALAARGIEGRGVSGLNVWIPVSEESTVSRALFQAGWAVQAGERYRIKSGPAIRVTVASLVPRDAERVADELANVLRPRGRTGGASRS